MAHLLRILYSRNLPGAPRLERLGRRRVVDVDVDNHRVTSFGTPCFTCRMGICQAVTAGLGLCAIQPWLVLPAGWSQPRLPAPLPATEYNAPGALRVRWKASSVSPRIAA